jgi:acyl-CoA synthetase (AMP-forming)/AMP-acid ligase II
VFEATIVGEPDRAYLRTGDLGFVADGELFVTGRINATSSWCATAAIAGLA